MDNYWWSIGCSFLIDSVPEVQESCDRWNAMVGPFREMEVSDLSSNLQIINRMDKIDLTQSYTDPHNMRLDVSKQTKHGDE